MLFLDKKWLIHVHCQKCCSKKPPNPTALYPPNSPRMLYYLLQMSGDPGLTKPTSALSDPNFVDNRNVQMNGSAVLPQAYDEFGNAINENMVSHYSLGCFKLFRGIWKTSNVLYDLTDTSCIWIWPKLFSLKKFCMHCT